jgi:hypothetical protein
MTCALSALLCATSLSACVTPPPTPDMRGAVTLAPGAPGAVTTPFLFDDNRVFVPIAFVLPDGSERQALAWMNMGSAGPALTNALYRELGVGEGRRLRMKIGGREIDVDPRTVQPETEVLNFSLSLTPHHAPVSLDEQAAYAARQAQGPGGTIAALVAPLKVEAVLPAGVLAPFRVTLDYGARTLTLAAPDGPPPEGVAVPIRVNPSTGFATVQAVIDGRPHALVLDDGGSYSGVSLALAETLARRHPDWLRSDGGVGESNQGLDAFDVGAPVLRARQAQLGGLQLQPFGMAGFGMRGPVGALVGGAFWRYYSAKAGEPVEGWIGGNVLKAFSVTLDYPHAMSYWRQEAPLDLHDLDQVGLVLARAGAATTIVGVARKDGRPTAVGVAPGDRLLSIDGKPVADMTRGALLAALHGQQGETRRLEISRRGVRQSVDLPVTAF